MRYVLSVVVLLLCLSRAPAVEIYTINGNNNQPVSALVEFTDDFLGRTQDVATDQDGYANVTLTVGFSYMFEAWGPIQLYGFLGPVYISSQSGVVVIYLY